MTALLHDIDNRGCDLPGGPLDRNEPELPKECPYDDTDERDPVPSKRQAVEYHDNATCGACKGPLECDRDAVCHTCVPDDWYFSQCAAMQRAIEIQRATVPPVAPSYDPDPDRLVGGCPLLDSDDNPF